MVVSGNPSCLLLIFLVTECNHLFVNGLYYFYYFGLFFTQLNRFLPVAF
jgi:hypothetical protein